MCRLHLSRVSQRERGSSLQRRTAGQVIARRRVARDCASICLASHKTSAGDPSRIFACAKNFKTALATNLTRFTKLTKSAMLGARYGHTPVDADSVQEDSDDHLENTPQSSRALPNPSSKWRGGSFRVSTVAETTLMAFLAIHGTLNGRHRLVSRFSEMIWSAGESTLVWLYEIWPSALHRKQDLPVHKSRASRNVDAIELSAAGKKVGFFSTVKPNLRNAP